MNSSIELITHWENFKKNAGEESLADFAAWLWSQQTRRRLTEKEINEVEMIKFKIVEISRLVESSIKRPLRFHDYRILTEVHKQRKPKKLDVISKLGIDSSTGFYLIKGLVRRKLLKQEKNPEDRRAFLVELTQKGQLTLEQARIEFSKSLPLEAIASDTKAREVFIRTLQKIYSLQQSTHKSENE